MCQVQSRGLGHRLGAESETAGLPSGLFRMQCVSPATVHRRRVRPSRVPRALQTTLLGTARDPTPVICDVTRGQRG